MSTPPLTDDEIHAMRISQLFNSDVERLLAEIERLRAENAMLSHRLTVALSTMREEKR